MTEPVQRRFGRSGTTSPQAGLDWRHDDPVPPLDTVDTWLFRPHHLMCWQTYRGKGYSEAFVANFDRLKVAAVERPDQPIQLAIATDPICEPCPHRRAATCETAESNDARDQALLDETGFNVGEVLALDAALATVAPRFLELQAHVCVGCKWQTFCRETFVAGDPQEMR